MLAASSHLLQQGIFSALHQKGAKVSEINRLREPMAPPLAQAVSAAV